MTVPPTPQAVPNAATIGGESPQQRVLERKHESTVELGRLRHSELKSICNRLDRMCKRELDWVRVFGASALLFMGGLIAGCLGAISFWTTSPTHQAKVYYVMALAASAILATISLLVRMAVKGEREDSVEAIKADLDEILNSYELTPRQSDRN